MLTEEALRALLAAIGQKLRDLAEAPGLDVEAVAKASEAVRSLGVVRKFVMPAEGERVSS